MINLLILGGGEAGRMIVSEILENEKIASKYRVVGLLDDDESKKNILGFPVLGKLDAAPQVIAANQIDEVIIAIPSAESALIQRILRNMPQTGVEIKIVPGMYEIIEGRFTLNQVRNIKPEDLLGREEIGFDTDVIAPFYRDKTVMVTGAGGSIGSEIVTELLELPIQRVVAFGRGENSIHSLWGRAGVDKRFVYVIGDVRDSEKLNYEMSRFRPDIVFHAAAHKHVPLMEEYPDEAIKNNVFGTYHTALSAIQYGVKNFLFVSTDKAVNPTSIMGASKRIAERLVLSQNQLQDKTRFCLTRFGNVLGSRGSVIPIFKEQIERGGPVTVTDPEMTRFFMSIREASRLVIKAMTVKNGTIFVLDMGKPVRIVELARNLIGLYGYTESEIPIVFTGLRKGEKLYEEVLSQSEFLRKSQFQKLLVSDQSEILLNPSELDTMLHELKSAVETYHPDAIRQVVKKYVPEYQYQGWGENV